MADGVVLNWLVDEHLVGAPVVFEPLDLTLPLLASSGYVCKRQDPCNLSVVPSGGHRDGL